MKIIKTEEDDIVLKGNLCHNISGNVIALVATVSADRISTENEQDTCFLISDPSILKAYSNSKAVFIIPEESFADIVEKYGQLKLVGLKNDNTLKAGDIITIAQNGNIYREYRTNSTSNFLFLTQACNNYCVMCPQPPKIEKENHSLTKVKKVLSLLQPEFYPEVLGITGGEPTLLQNDLLEIVDLITTTLPNTRIHLLSNGRAFSSEDYSKQLAINAKGRIVVAIPIFSHVANLHDHIVQCRHAFDQAVAGIYELHKQRVSIEIRVVLNKLTIPYLLDIAEFIARNFCFATHVALMGMENMGFAKLNRDEVYIDPLDYKNTLTKAVKILSYANLHVTVYNLPLCVVDDKIHSFCQKSISDYKRIYYDICSDCLKMDECGGLFLSSNEKFPLTQGITPFTA